VTLTYFITSSVYKLTVT